MKLTCIIVDDEPLALDILEDHVRRTPALSLMGRFAGSADALSLLGAQGGDGGRGIDLAFLDIQMPGMNGIDLAKTIGDKTRVIFTTAFPQYALEGFRVDALDYLLKPVSFGEFTRSVEKAVEWFDVRRAAEAASNGGEPRVIVVKSAYKQFVIPLDNIVYIEGIRDYIRIHTMDAAGMVGAVQTLMNMKTVEEMLPRSRFARVHRSYIVNLDRIEKIERAHLVLHTSTRSEAVSIPISDTYKETFAQSLAGRAV
ncbi:MAG: LytTR family DNA-binding domain-containing protein [Alistipes sp.]|jgi:DNA-binding LytR/AlgR family response regulator|nr:LytTR family DNA-binding domain-containing protein [Alistipes sp.]